MKINIHAFCANHKQSAAGSTLLYGIWDAKCTFSYSIFAGTPRSA